LGYNNQLSWSSNSSETNKGVNTTVTLQNNENTNALNANLYYNDSRGRIGFNQFFQNNPGNSGNNPLSLASQIVVESAIAFADGEWAITRPIRDSFVLVVPHPNLEGQIIELNPFQAGAAAEIDAWGNGVLPDLQSYRVSKVTIDAPDLPPGYDLGPSSYHVLPTYKSGTLIRIGSDATVIIRGILVNIDKKPWSLKLVEVKSLDEPERQSLTFFTNRAGKFVAEGFNPGNYEGRILGEEREVIRFVIPANLVGIYDLGILPSAQN
jgi:outer membrane usher protein